MNRAEWIARGLVGLLVLTAVSVPLILRGQAPMIHARMAEAGGWSTDSLQAAPGVPLRLRLISDDVVHGFAVGQHDSPEVELLPGKVTSVSLLFDQPGTYTFYCTRWCGVNHWRMRGTIEVSGAPTAPQSPRAPLYVSQGIDLDAARTLPAAPVSRPVANIPERQQEGGLARYRSVDYYRVHSPYEAWADLRSDPAFSGLSDPSLWNLTAFLWESNVTPAGLAEGQRLFEKNCAACHGQGGRGDGVFSDDLAPSDMPGPDLMSPDSRMIQSPAVFTDPQRILTASPALLQGKILRGGMGTGMPAWGPIFTEEQTWNLAAYLYTFQFTYP